MDWLVVLNIFRIIFALLILLFGSYRDIKSRTVDNKLWVIFGLLAISLLECEIIIELGVQAFQYLILVVPIMIVFMSFLVCDYIYDLEKKMVNEPWIFLTALAAFSFLYLILIDPAEEFESVFSALIAFAPFGLFLLYFIFIQSILNYSYFQAFNKYKKKKIKIQKKATKEKKRVELTKILTSDAKIEKTDNRSTKLKKHKTDKGQNVEQSIENNGQLKEELVDINTSWMMFFWFILFIIISIVMNDIILFEEARIIGLIVLVAIPIIVLLFYLKYITEIGNPDSSNTSKVQNANRIENSDSNSDNISYDVIPFDDPDFRPPNQFIIYFLFFGLIFFGFLNIIYYSVSEQVSEILKMTFISIIWIILLYGFYNFGIPRGGADTKALMALVILFPSYPIIPYLTLNTDFFTLIDTFPITTHIFPMMFTILINAAFVMLFYVLILFIHNIYRSDLKFPNSLFGYKLAIEDVPKKFVWLMERYIDGELKFVPFPKEDIDLQAELDEFRAKNISHVWVTPKVPFLIPITLGLIFAVIIGNFVFLLIGIFI